MSPHYALRSHLAWLSCRISSYNSISLFTCGTIVFRKLWCKFTPHLFVNMFWSVHWMPCAKCECMRIVPGKDKPLSVSFCDIESKHFLLFTALYHNELYFFTSYLFFILHNQLRVFLLREYIYHHPSEHLHLFIGFHWTHGVVPSELLKILPCHHSLAPSCTALNSCFQPSIHFFVCLCCPQIVRLIQLFCLWK